MVAYETSGHLSEVLSEADREKMRQRLDAISTLLDSAVRIPGTSVNVGVDAVLSFIPIVGPLTGGGISAYLIWEAWRLGAPKASLNRMAVNVGIDAAISAIPLVGWFGDVFFRANARNMNLLRAHLDGASNRVRTNINTKDGAR